LVEYLRKVSRVLFERITKDQWEKHEEAVVHYVNLKASIDDYYNENITHIDQTNQLVEASMSSLEKSSSTINDLYKGLEVITQLLQDIINSVKDNPATNKKIEEASETLAKISTQTTEILSSAQPIIIIHREPSIPQKEGKGITIDDQAKDQIKVVKASSIICHVPDEPVRVEFMINGKIVYLTEQEIQEDWDKEEEIKKAKKEARLNSISKTEVINVVRKEAKKLGIHLKEAITIKAGELFKKAQEAEHDILKRQHTEKVRKSLKLKKHKYDSYMWTVSSRLKPKPITDIKIHPKTKPVVIIFYRCTDGRNFDVHKPFLFRAFGISELDKLKEIILKKKNTVVKDLMNSLSQRCETSSLFIKLEVFPCIFAIISLLPLCLTNTLGTTGLASCFLLDLVLGVGSVEVGFTEVIEFGDSYEVPKDSTATGSASDGKKGRTVAITTEDMRKRRNDVKARTTLFLARPDEHQLRLSKYKMAQELWAAILKTFGKETLEQTFNKLQAIISQLEFMDVEIEQDDLNQKLLTSLAPEWLMHKIVWRNRSDLDTMSLDDLYNHLKVYEPKVQKKSDSQNMAFISSSKNNSRNEEDNTASVPTASTQVSPTGATVAPSSINLDTACAYIASQSNGSQIKYEDINQIDEDDIEEMDIKWNMALLSMRADRFWKKTGKKISIQGTDVAGFDKSKSYMENDEENHALVADEEAPIEFTLMAKTSTDNEVFDNSLCSKACLSQVKGRLVEFKNQEIKFCEKIRGLEFSVECKTNRIENLINELEILKKEKEGLESKLAGFKSATKDLDNLIGSQRSDNIKEGLGNSVVPPPAQVYSLLKKAISSFASENGESTGSILSKPEIKFVRPADSLTVVKTDKKKTVRKPTAKYVELYRKTSKIYNVRGGSWAKNKNTHKSRSPRTVFHKTGRPPMRTNRPYMNAAQPKRTSFYNPARSYLKRPFQITSVVRSQFRGPRVPTVNRKFPTVNRKFPTNNSKFSTADMGSKGKAGNSQNNIDDKRYWDSGCSRHMTGNISYLTDYDPYDGGYVSFGQGGCKITGKGTIKTECIVLGRNFKLSDDANVLLRTPRQHNMYSIDLNNVVPHKDLTFLVAKAFADELIDDFSRFTWTFFLKTKDETSGILRNFITKIENLKELRVKIIRCDNGGEFRNKKMNDFCSRKGIKREFSNAKTPQQNEVAERRNKTLIEEAKTMLADAKLPVTFWAEAVNTACYVQNRVLGSLRQKGRKVILLDTLCLAKHLGYLIREPRD
nr:ribonuclease H-like domain-containing protein [Tanacetum cinerariifolium]